MKSIKFLSILLIVLLIGCNDNDSSNDNDFTVSDFMTTINENPQDAQSIGFIEGTFGNSATFSIISQSETNAFGINTNTGELFVETPEVFDFEMNTSITGTVEVTYEEETKNATITINLIDINEVNIEATDLEILLETLPVSNQNLGILEATSNQGDVTFEIFSQAPVDALSIDTNTGEIISNNTITNFVENPIAHATIRLESSGFFITVDVTVKLTLECDTSANLVAYYPMSGNANDESGFANDGQVNGAVLATDRFGNQDSAYYFDGNDDDIRILDNEQLYLGDSFTLSAWVKVESTKTQHILRKGPNVNGPQAWPYGLGFSGSGDVVFSITADNTLHQARKMGYTLGEWKLVTGVLKNQKMYLYVNDQLVGYEEITGAIFNDELPLIIGTQINLPSGTLDGTIDEVRIYHGALCESEIQTLYNAN